MKPILWITVGAVALTAVVAPASAQMSMPGMNMPMPHKPSAQKMRAQKATAKKSGAKKSAPRGAVEKAHAQQQPASGAGTTMPMAQTAAPTDESQMQQGMAMPAPPPAGASMSMPMGPMAGMNAGTNGDHQMAMTGALGPYPMQRESSGTAWQPDASEHSGVMTMNGDWTLMAHGVLNLVYDHQSGPRGDDKAFASGMLMGMARRPLGNGAIQFKAMVSPDPLMGPRGYPLLLASGETANGVDRLIDRQHPHDLFMELSGSVSQNIGPKGSLFLYAGLPGEPAFGPPAFMHREAIMDSPEAPITHHWLDSTHISFGVLTAGIVLDAVKLEVSRFNGREPDQHRWNIETGPLDSTAVRLSWNPVRTLALQASWGHFTDPEQLEPGIDQKRLSASALWADDIALGWHAAATVAWGRKTAEHHNDDAFAAEASVKHAAWTIFGRAETAENRELGAQVADGSAYQVGKLSLGAVRDVSIANHLSVGAGGLFAVNFVPDALSASYGGSQPTGAMVFVRLKLN